MTGVMIAIVDSSYALGYFTSLFDANIIINLSC